MISVATPSMPRLRFADHSDFDVEEPLGARRPPIVPSLAGKTAVVVEDEGVTQLQIRTALTRAGMKVLGSASDGIRGVETALSTRPDVVLMDINMPGEIDGLEATRRILAAIKTCVIVLTAYDQYRDEARAAGAAGYLMKPIISQTLIPEVKAASDAYYIV